MTHRCYFLTSHPSPRQFMLNPKETFKKRLYSAFLASFSPVVRPPWFGLGRGPTTPPDPAMVRTDQKDLNSNKTKTKIKKVQLSVFPGACVRRASQNRTSLPTRKKHDQKIGYFYGVFSAYRKLTRYGIWGLKKKQLGYVVIHGTTEFLRLNMETIGYSSVSWRTIPPWNGGIHYAILRRIILTKFN